MSDQYLKELEVIFDNISKIPTVFNNTITNNTDVVKISQLTNELENKNKENVELKLLLEQYKKELEYLKANNIQIKINEIRLRTELLKIKGNVCVYCRIKPYNNLNIIQYNNNNIIINDKKFQVDKVFGPLSSQKDVFSEIEFFVDNIFAEYNLCIFSYGQTGSGKTYTMEGKNKDGLIYQIINKINSSLNNVKVKYNLKYIEIYNDHIIDLFTGNEGQLQMKNDKVEIKNVTEIITDNTHYIIEQIQKSILNRKKCATNCNLQSSRSHAMLILNIQFNFENHDNFKNSTLCLIDLAGSERIYNSNVKNINLKETQNINKSLSTLGNVFTAIKNQELYIPFRESKLTYIMQNYLKRNSQIILIININLEHINETICSLRFATKVSECNNHLK